jgi:hypothetical protein
MYTIPDCPCFNTKSLSKQIPKFVQYSSTKVTSKTLIHKTKPTSPKAQSVPYSLHPANGIEAGKKNVILLPGLRLDHTALSFVACD